VLRKLALILAIAATIGLAGCRRPASGRPTTGTVTVNGHVWRVEIVDTPEKRWRGLSGRREVPEGTGMLFVYDEPGVMGFVMRDMVIPLDIAFIDEDLEIVRIHTMAVEPDRNGDVVYPSDAPAQYALEVRAGSFERAGIHEGDGVVFSEGITGR
jgi:uncharacterized membrane protein (UPF0127 family)